MLECDGYKMFHGTVRINPINGREPFDLTGTWLHKPEYVVGEVGGIWICKPDHDFTRSFSPDILSDFREDE